MFYITKLRVLRQVKKIRRKKKDEDKRKKNKEEEEKEEEKEEAEEKKAEEKEEKVSKANYEKELAKARALGRKEAEEAAVKIQQEKAEAKLKKAEAKKKKDEKKRKFKTRLDKEVAKRLSKMPMCSGKGNGTGKNGTKGRLGGTDVFKGKNNATDAVGIVGKTHWSINEPPYKVERCDQILLIKGKKLDLDNYCEKEESFMTMSIYMINFFQKKDVNKLIDSYSMHEITSMPTELAGAPGCTMWSTKTKSFPFCYESREVLKEIEKAYIKFMNCKNPKEVDMALELKRNCNLAKMNLTAAGPFGEQGPIFREMLEAIDPSLFAEKKKVDLSKINPYYISDENARVPGDHITVPKTLTPPQ